MAKDLSTIPSSSSDGEDLDINQITNSGSDTDRDDFNNDINKDTPPPSDGTGKDTPPTPPNSDPAKPEEGADGDDNDNKDVQELQNILSSFSGDELDEDSQALKSQLLEKFGGTSFNENGDIVDEDGNITTSVNDVLKSLDDDSSSLNDNGDLVDADGNVIKTKAELAVENSVVNKLHSELDYEFLDEDGKPKIYSDDDAGMQEFTTDVANYKLEQFKEGFFSQNAELAEVSKHLLSGGTLETFKQPVDYSKIEVKSLTPEQKEKYIRESFKASGMGDSRIDAMVKRIKDSNDIDAEAEEALADLTVRDKEAKKERDAAYQKSIDERNQEVAKYWEEVEQVVTKGQLANLNVPDSDKQEFLDYISRPVDDKGNSKEMLDSSKESMEQKLAFAYIRYKGYKLDDLIDSKAKTKTVLSLKERLKRSAKIKPTPANDANGITSGKNVDVSINDLLP